VKRRRRFQPVTDYLVYVAVRLIVAVAQALTIEQSYRLADALAALMYRVDRRHRAVAMENLRLAFGDRHDEAGRDAIVRAVYRHFCRMIMEMLHIPRKLHLTTWRDRIRLVGHEPVLDRLLAGGPVIMLSGHFGNWEMAGYLFGVFGFAPHAVARPLDNPHLERFLRRFRERTGQKLIAKKGGFDEMLGVLRSGGVLSILADQDAGERGLFVDFFGRPASTHKAIALLAIEYDAPVVMGYARRIGPGFRYEVGCNEVIEPADWKDEPDPVRYITRRWTVALERAVRLAPEQYLWLHRRWKHQPKPRKGPLKGPHAAAPAAAERDAAGAP
jgi:KDO2-lipid IV(A) lauroyltransferase